MDHQRERPTAWEELARTLAGSFSARIRGILNPELLLLTPDGEPFGRLTASKPGGSHLRADNLTAEIEPAGRGGASMTTGGAETLLAEASGPATLLRLRSGGRLYEARISLLRNRATARSSDGNEAVRLSGGLTNRRYRASFEPEDPASLPVAIFLLHHTVMLRSKAYRTRP